MYQCMYVSMYVIIWISVFVCMFVLVYVSYVDKFTTNKLIIKSKNTENRFNYFLCLTIEYLFIAIYINTQIYINTLKNKHTIYFDRHT